MLLTRIQSHGLALDVDLDELEAAAPLGARAVAAADALTLWAQGLSPRPDLSPLGWPLPDTEADDGLVSPLHPGAVRAAIGADELTVEVSIAPDPPLYGRLREHAVRDPRLVSALGQAAALHVKVGWRLPRDLESASADLLGARIGDVAFPIAGAEVPPWLRPLLTDLAGRIHRVDLEEPWSSVVGRLHAAALSPLPGPRAAWRRVADALVTLGLPAPALVTGPRLAFGEAVTDARLFGRGARDVVRVVEAALLRAPDVLVLPDPLPDTLLAWVRARTEGDDATLEQVLG